MHWVVVRGWVSPAQVQGTWVWPMGQISWGGSLHQLLLHYLSFVCSALLIAFFTSITLPAVLSGRHMVLSCSAGLYPSDACSVSFLREVKTALWGRDEPIQMQWGAGTMRDSVSVSIPALFECSHVLLLIHPPLAALEATSFSFWIEEVQDR